MKWCAIVSLCLLACGGPAPHVEPQVPAAQPPTPSEASHTAPSELSKDDCTQLFEHIFAIAVLQQRETLPEEERPTDADIQEAKNKKRVELIGRCVGAPPQEFAYECALAATNVTDLKECMGAE